MIAHADDSFGPAAGSVRPLGVSLATPALLTITSSLTGSLLLPTGRVTPKVM